MKKVIFVGVFLALALLPVSRGVVKAQILSPEEESTISASQQELLNSLLAQLAWLEALLEQLIIQGTSS